MARKTRRGQPANGILQPECRAALFRPVEKLGVDSSGLEEITACIREK